MAQHARGADVAGTEIGVVSGSHPQRNRIREDRRRLTMATDDDRRESSHGADWTGRLRGAWRALRGEPAVDNRVGGATPPLNLTIMHPQSLLIESLIGGLPGPAIVLDREGRVIAFNAAATTIAPALRQGEPALITLRMPDLVDAIRRAGKRREPQRVEFFERVPLDRWFEAFVTPVRLATEGEGPVDILL